MQDPSRKLSKLPQWTGRRRFNYVPRIQNPVDTSLDLWAWAERLSIVGLFFIALGYTAFALQSILVPIILAWVVGTILLPLLDAGVRRGVPRPVAAVLVALTALFITLGIIVLLSTPLTYWIGRTGELGALVKQKIELLNQPLALFQEVGKALSEISGRPADAVTVDSGSSNIVTGFLSVMTPIVSEFVLFFFALIFYLLYQNQIKSGVVYFFSGDQARAVVRNILDDAEANTSTFFGTLALVNLCLGIVAAILTWAVGLPHPLLWGVLAATLNFIPYLGAMVMLATLFVIGLMTLPTIGSALIAPVAYLAITTIEGQAVTPAIIGHRLTLNPFMVFLSIAFWTWMWGPVGAFVAVPLLISAVIAVRHLSGDKAAGGESSG